MKVLLRVGFALTILGGSAMLRADDLRGTDRFLCAAIQATACFVDGECVMDVPSNLNVPQFIVVDLKARSLATTKASGENRSTPVDHLRRADGKVVLQGYEQERAFSIVIHEESGELSAAVAQDGRAVSVFGSCTPAVGVP
jgi:hypothetical protein